MKKTILITCLTISTIAFSQKRSNKGDAKLVNKYESKQPQDFSVPPPPVNPFPAQFPDGNKMFVKKIEQNLNKNVLAALPKSLHTELIIKIDDEGNVINISAYGKDETFNDEVKVSAAKSTEKIKWIAGKNNRGEKVVDMVRIPFHYKNN
ncbi:MULTISPECIES: hypothetical protein [Chryseobacterium]|uniref:hypothetical protein n=1 Tax=Chryseobacterium TaxID=59732 RepID=UPI0016259E78|nr:MULTISPECIES: hypothetical protein [Chryseobacterium]MDM1554493.1 hypothetical protein [Chryseobacterium indologenes]